MIRIENLSKNYGSVQAVNTISFSLNDGEIVGFLGANGAGKSTTLKMMTGYITPTSGNVFVDDIVTVSGEITNISNKNESRIISLSLNLSTQENNYLVVSEVELIQ